jgi:hypothetical protein
MNADTQTEIQQVIDHHYTNQHAPLIQWAWSPFFSAGFGPGWMLTAQIFGFLLGGYLVLRAVFGRMGSAITMSVIAVTPQMIGMLGLVGRDTWFLSSLMLGFGFTSEASRRSGALKHVLEFTAAFWLFFALATRQNAAPAIVVGAALLAWPYVVRWSAVAKRSGWLQVAAVVAVAFVSTVFASVHL